MSRSGTDDAGVVVHAVILELDEEVLAPEDVLEPRRRGERGLVVTLQDQLRDEAAEAATRRDDALVVLLEQLPVAARLVVVAVEVRGAVDLDEVAVALVRRREHREVEDLVVGALGPFEARRVGEVALHPEHGRDAGIVRRPVELEDPVHVAVIGDPHRGLTVGGRGGDDLVDARGTVEHGVLGVEMEVDERIGHCVRVTFSTGAGEEPVDESHRCHFPWFGEVTPTAATPQGSCAATRPRCEGPRPRSSPRPRRRAGSAHPGRRAGRCRWWSRAPRVRARADRGTRADPCRSRESSRLSALASR